MTGQDLSVMVGFICILAGLATFTFKTKSDCGACQAACKKEIYSKIEAKGNKNEEFFIQIIKDLATLTERVSNIGKHGGG